MKARTGVMAVGIAWPVVLVLGAMLFGERDAWVWALAGMGVLVFIFVPAAFVFSLIVPTIKSRILFMPFLLLGYFLSFGQSAFNYPAVPIMFLWMVSFTAITLFLPEVRTMRRLYARLFLKSPTSAS